MFKRIISASVTALLLTTVSAGAITAQAEQFVEIEYNNTTFASLSERQVTSKKNLQEIINENKAEAERIRKEKEEAARLEAERQEAERLEAERLEAERLEAERIAVAAAEQAAVEVSQQQVQNTAQTADYYQGGEGVLTKSKGVNYFNGQKETYYSQRVLPGGGLNIPGRHVAADGTIRDADNYIVVASDRQAKGETGVCSLGPYKVYDTGVGHDGIDIYTDW